jgi:hypothetical protein
MLYPEPQIVSRLYGPQLFSGEGHAVYAGTCGFVTRLGKKPQVPAKSAWASEVREETGACVRIATCRAEPTFWLSERFWFS